MTAPPRDFAPPEKLEPRTLTRRELGPITYEHGAFDPPGVERILKLVGAGGESLRSLSKPRLWRAWERTASAFLDPGSEERRALEAALVTSSRLSPEALTAGLEAILEGVRGEPAQQLFDRATPAADSGPALLVLPGNIPGVLVQSLLPALAVRRPVVVKSASEEPFFAPAFVSALTMAEPALASALAVLTWRGGDAGLEEAVFAKVSRIIGYGDEATAESLARRYGSRAIVYGPKISVALVGARAEPKRIAAGLARDVALFDQRGCLSIHAVFTAGNPRELALSLAEELSRLAKAWPPGRALPSEQAGLRQALAEAEMRGLEVVALDPVDGGATRSGTVIVDPEPVLRPSPGLRCVRVHPVSELWQLPEILAPWEGKLQGAALAGEEARNLTPRLTQLGFSRFTAPGDLQATDALWFNGGIDPVAALS